MDCKEMIIYDLIEYLEEKKNNYRHLSCREHFQELKECYKYKKSSIENLIDELVKEVIAIPEELIDIEAATIALEYLEEKVTAYTCKMYCSSIRGLQNYYDTAINDVYMLMQIILNGTKIKKR